MAEKTILVVVEPSRVTKQPVLERAAWLAKQVGGKLELFAVDYNVDIDAGRVSKVWIPESGLRERVLLEHRQTLDALAKPLRASGLTVTVDVAWDCPLGEAIVRKVVASQPWVVAKDTHHHDIIERTLFTNTDWHLIANCPAPLLLVKPRPLAERPNVFAAVDPLHEHDKPAQLDHAIFDFAQALATATRGNLHVVHSHAAPMGIELPPRVRDMLVQEHAQAMSKFVAERDVVLRNVHLVEGFAHESLPRAAVDFAADFVVMGAVARRGFKKLFIGSTAERVLDRLPCDLVIIKPDGFKAPVA
jgi:universal stress protein E